MTPAELVAEALEHAEETTPEEMPDHLAPGESDWFSWRSIDVQAEGRGRSFMSAREGNYMRVDVAEAALTHLAARVVAERERAERAIQETLRLIRSEASMAIGAANKSDDGDDADRSASYGYGLARAAEMIDAETLGRCQRGPWNATDVVCEAPF